MDEKFFVGEIQKLLEGEQNIDMEMRLADIPEWDSLTMIQFTLAIRKDAGKVLTVRQLAKCETVRDVYALVQVKDIGD